jgi:ParB/RepB/Spo0J family partition protein
LSELAVSAPADATPPPSSLATDALVTGPGGSMVALQVKLSALAPHPANPRTELGDLTELQASIAQVGVLEPLVVVTVAAHVAAGWPAVADEAQYVILAGHRRCEGAREAGHTLLPIVVRDDLAGSDALVVMLSENGDGIRKGLDPLAEARAMQELADRRWSQRKIAERIGCAQGQVSKRLTLLRLPEQAREALVAGRISTADAGELARLAGNPTRVQAALKQVGAGLRAKDVVERQIEDQRDQENRARRKEELMATGLQVIDPGIFKHGAYLHRLYPDTDDDGDDLRPHRNAGCLVAAVGYRDAEYYCRAPEKHADSEDMPAAYQRSMSNHTIDEAKDRNLAQRQRTEAGVQLATEITSGQDALTAAQAAPLLAAAVIDRGTDASTLKMATRWIRELGNGPETGDPFIRQTATDADAYTYASQVRASDQAALPLRLALVMTVVAQEQHVRMLPHAWDQQVVAYYERLVTEVDYQPTEWELTRLEQTRQKLAARARLSCPACGCTHDARAKHHYSCDVRRDAKAQDGWIFSCASPCHPAEDASLAAAEREG